MIDCRMRFAVLGSGSSGNCCFLSSRNFGMLIDFGFGPSRIGQRLAAIGASWKQVHAVLLTHTHGDHWSSRSLAEMRRRGIPLWCHREHHEALASVGREFRRHESAGLVRCYGEEPVWLAPKLLCQPLLLRHDSKPTFGFRLERRETADGPADAALGFVSDLGCHGPDLVRALSGVDLLALEFNHDVELEEASGRHPLLIERVLGEEGHLSNQQAAELVEAVLAASGERRPRQLVPLHLSRQCNRPALALAAVRERLGRQPGLEVHVSSQDRPVPPLLVAPAAPRSVQPCLPGMELG